jgi:hypothetical protein
LAFVWMLTNLLQPLLDEVHWRSVSLAFGPIGSRPLLLYSAASLLLGAQLLSLGFLAELIVAYTGRESDTYSVAERIGAARGASGDPPARHL